MRIGSCTGSNAKLYSKLPLLWSDGPINILGVNIFPNIEKTVNCNYEQILDKIENLSKIWGSRSLSIIGKIQIVNTLFVSQFIYKLQCLPSPNKNVIERYNKIVNNMGLKCVNTELKDKSMKVAHYVKLAKNLEISNMHTIQSIALTRMLNIPAYCLLNHNLNIQDMIARIKNSPVMG